MPPRIILPRPTLSFIRSSQCSSSSSIAPITDSLNQTSRQLRRIRLASPHRSWVGQYRMNSSASDGGKKNHQVESEQPVGPNQDQLPHVSEEAAATAKILDKRCGEVGGPELEQGTPIADILKRDKDALKNMPKVLRDELAGQNGGAKRSFSTSAGLRQEEQKQNALPDMSTVHEKSLAAFANMLDPASKGVQAEIPEGFKFEPPTLPLPPNNRLNRRYEPLVDQFTKLIMLHGKLSLAQKHMAKILEHLRTAPSPQLDPSKPFLPAPSGLQLSLNPILYLTLIIDSVAPLFKMKMLKGFTGGGTSLPIPYPLSRRQRRRVAISWILDAADKRKDNQLSARIANEIISIAEGKSGAWLKRATIHKQAATCRANIRRAMDSRRGGRR